MDFRVKITDVPSVRDHVAQHGKCLVNNLLFGFSDKLGAIVSEPANHAQVEAFRRIPGYVIIDANTGDLISTPEQLVLPGELEAPPAEEPPPLPAPPEKRRLKGEDSWLKDFKKRFAVESKRQNIEPDEYRRALSALNVVTNMEQTKDELIALLIEALAQPATE